MRAPYVLLIAFSLLGSPAGFAEKRGEASLDPAAFADAGPSPAAKARAATVDCAPGADCSPSVGLLSMASAAEASQCTASLVAPDIVATNGHCVPEDLRAPGASCAGRVWVNFVKAEGFESQIECESVIFVEKKISALTPETPDYAFYRLKSPSRRPYLRISRAGFAEGEEISFERVNPVKAEGKIYGVQEKLRCRAVEHSLLSVTATHPLAPITMVGDCAPVFGNSGSPLTGRDGSIRGVIHAKAGVTDQWFKAKKLELPEGLAPHGFGSNYACLPLPAEVNAPTMAAACAAIPPANESYAALGRLTPGEMGGFRGAWAAHKFSSEFLKYGPIGLKFLPECGPAPAPETGFIYRVRGSADRYGRLQSAELVAGESASATRAVPACER